ncbi:MAG: LPS export ABC transporter ATP-binding protein [Gammaproteobacteria bacterium]|jgi:lipopolysaccharide export system ATP-binding protein|nr:LPS export ABC transporter ATP-binding protein [Pseudomonadota bacterium]MDG2302688.1 LPS export ABC transporter ATP-binding protein [Gammaproteobacteria bacterium]MBT5065784.1 LPS export ABC transporter ATP-binding protein [Pseudomonadota bacterium]MBT6192785.1 LPS export ABC transporter ATP-binding protein [Pseudomonadota bacterium]MBT6465007.1 LPS export ABC transporter ATP-binding protein [Pseudomonadota bacterium]
MSVLTVKNLSKTFKSRMVVKDVTLDLESGEVVGLLGPNGAGKTTSFYMIVGLIKSDRGSIMLDQEEISFLSMDARARKGIGYLPQEASVFRKLTVEDNIMGVLEIRKNLSLEQRRKKLESLLKEFHIDHIRNSVGISLSGGERRRVEIARALASEPRFILLDEPFAGVDPISVGDIQQIVSHLKNLGIGVLITDHNVQETLKICDRAYIVNEGTIIAEGKPEKILENEVVRQVYLGDNFSIT